MNQFKEKNKQLIGLKAYLKSIRIKNMLWAWIGSFLTISLIGYVHDYLHILSDGAFTMMIASFGASAVMAFGVMESPLAQPKNIICGHMLSAIVGVISYKLFGSHIWLASSVAVSTSIVVMLLTKTLHPPGGATALTAVIGGTNIHNLGYLFPFVPVGVGASVVVLIAMVINNIPKNSKYPNV
ncbi:HPP familiy integral membrane protein [Gottschalkia acidurici 9a]|uniref:HPP familiy integral membrane protein n=1 Tax=Gottschalkia acidurici (strain ATCC 7906 / DSM 604 / BCRC 14475 / CIP 104303 / KCTC 5404 / NCIMB 10678 / 9a) TaxID=1128398 RepID=K0B423_GOTA9|nr:HPP family protein [Gottschalkia acidurici]AFS79680.1 HPP familiy integral membrane protein [Gottschalkia acidurici 9a]